MKQYIRDFSILKRNANCICPNDKLYLCVLVFCCVLSELGELRPWGQSAASETIHKGFLNPLWEMQTFVSPALCTEQIPEEGDGLTEFLFPKQTSLKKANGDLNMTSYCGWFSCKMVTDDTPTPQPTFKLYDAGHTYYNMYTTYHILSRKGYPPDQKKSTGKIWEEATSRFFLPAVWRVSAR